MNHRISVFIIAMIMPMLASANEVIYLRNAHGTYKSQSLSYGSYQDIRIDYNYDGQIDLWYLKKGNISITQKFSNGRLTELGYSRTLERTIQEVYYEYINGKLALSSANERNLEIFGFSGILFKEKYDDICKAQSTALDEIKAIGGGLSKKVLAVNLEESILDASCTGENSIFTEEQKSALVRGITIGLGDNKTKTISDCIASPKVAEAISSGLDKDKKDLVIQELKLVSLKYQLAVARFYKNPEAAKGKFACADGPNTSPISQTIENKNIIFYKKGNVKADEYAGVINHEILHDVGIANEKAVGTLVDICLYGKDIKKNKATISTNNSTNKSILAVKSNAVQASKKQAATAAPKVPKELAETQIQNPPVAVLNQPLNETPQQVAAAAQQPEVAAERALTESVSQSKGVFSTANNVLNAFGGTILPKAVAAENSEVGTSSGGSGLGSSRSSSRSPASSSKRSKSKSGDDDYKVVEEILVSDKKLKAKVKDTTSNGVTNSELGISSRRSNSRSPASTEAPSAEVAANPALGGSGGGGSSGFSSGGGSNSAAAVISGSGSGSGSRGPASTRAQRGPATSATPLSTMSRQDIISAFSQKTKYEDLKKQLSRDDVQRRLRANSITILDTAGNSIGATKGQIIFLDSGDAFVRQK